MGFVSCGEDEAKTLLACVNAVLEADGAPPESSYAEASLEQKPSSGFDWQPQESGQNYSGLTVRHVVPGRQTLQWNAAQVQAEVARVLWHDEAYESYTYSNDWWLVQFRDGRYGFVSSLSSGTCSYCGSCSDDVAVGDTLEEVVRLGMGDEDRRRLVA